MPSYSDIEYAYDDDDYYTDDSNAYDSHDEDESSQPDDFDQPYEDPDDLIYKDEDFVPTQWTTLYFNKGSIRVSNKGHVNCSNSVFESTEGIHVSGTPYRMVRVEIDDNIYRNYYIHELVWVAFNDDVPYGWEVGHKVREGDIYSNELSNLDIYKTVVDKGFCKYLY